MRMRQKTNFSINMEILICFSSLGNELPLRVNLHNNIDGPRYRAKEREESFQGESMWAHYRQYPGSYLNKREMFHRPPSHSICLQIGDILKKKERSQTNDHMKGKRVLMKSIEVKLFHTAPKRFISQKNFFN